MYPGLYSVLRSRHRLKSNRICAAWKETLSFQNHFQCTSIDRANECHLSGNHKPYRSIVAYHRCRVALHVMLNLIYTVHWQRKAQH